MDNREKIWKAKRLGVITASELDCLMSASGKIIDSNIAYVRRKRFERTHKFAYPVFGRALEIGREMEKYACAWYRENYPLNEIVYAQELEEVPFWKVDWADFGASPDAFSPDHGLIVEFKTLVGNSNIEFFSDDRTSYEEKRSLVLKEHGAQIMGQFLSEPAAKEAHLVKYVPQSDDVDEDIDSPLAPWRGTLFTFKREDFDLEELKKRIKFFDLFIDSDYDAKMLKKMSMEIETQYAKSEDGSIVDTIHVLK